MTLRAVWRGTLKFGTVTCAVKLVGATSEAERIHFRILNRKSLLPVKTAYVDEETGDTVPTKNQIKGYEPTTATSSTSSPTTSRRSNPSPITAGARRAGGRRRRSIAAIWRSHIMSFRPTPSSETFAVIREALRKKNAAARPVSFSISAADRW